MRKIVIGALLLLVGLGFVSALIYPFMIQRSIDATKIQYGGGNEYSIDVSSFAYTGYRLLGDVNDYPMRSSLILMRDDVPIGPAHTVTVTLKMGVSGNGSYSHWDDRLFFSVPGNTDPRTDGHRYSFKARLSPGVGLSLVLGFAGVLALASGALLLLSALPSSLKKRAAMIVMPLKLIAILFCISEALYVAFGQLETLFAKSQYFLSIVYVCVTALSLVGLFLVPFLRNWLLRATITFVLVIGLAFDSAIYIIYGQHLIFDLMEVLWKERDIGGGVITAYQAAILSSLFVSVPVAIAFVLPPKRWFFRPVAALVPIASFIATAAAIYFSNDQLQLFSPTFGVPSQFALLQIPTKPKIWIHGPVEYSGAIKPLAKKIIMVVDESVRGDYVGFNNPKLDNTPFLTSNIDRIANYGTAVSTANCSGSARVILRSGLQRKELPDLTSSWGDKPMVWAYAHKAGFRTAMIDAWHKERPFHSYMTPTEEKDIDFQYYPDNEPHYVRDMVVADKLVELLHRDEPLFIYVNKLGTHMDYAKAFPPDIEYDPSQLVASLPLDDRRRSVVRDYHKAIRWSVDGFFEKVLPAIWADPSAVLVYTSDHGQSLFEGGYDASHCSYNTGLAKGEVFVPLFVTSGSREIEAKLTAASKMGFNRAHHFDIFPTLLDLMGYPEDWTRKKYSPGLFDVPLDRELGVLLGTFNLPGAQWLPIRYTDMALAIDLRNANAASNVR